MNKLIAVDIDTLISKPADGAVSKLPSLTESALASNIIQTVLKFSMALTMIAIIVAGIFLLIARGNEDETSKAKKIISYLVVGMLVISSAYAIITGIAKINFF